MKKMIWTVLLLTVLFTITACGNNREKENPAGKPETDMGELTQSDSREEETQKAETEAAQKSDVQTEIQPTESEPKSTEQEVTEMKLKIQVGDTTFTATPAENSSVDALKELMAGEPLTLDMSDYASMEKGADLGTVLPQNNEQMNTQAGDVILYQGRTFVIYYDTNSWSLTPIAKIDNVDAEELRASLGTGDVTVTLYFE